MAFDTSGPVEIDVMNSDTVHLRTQIRQLKEVIAVLENQNDAEPGMAPETVLDLTLMDDDESSPIHPRLRDLTHGHKDVDSLRRGLKRLENDLEDLQRGPRELSDPPKHDIVREDSSDEFDDDYADDESVELPDEVLQRDDQQRSLWAYINPVVADDHDTIADESVEVPDTEQMDSDDH